MKMKYILTILGILSLMGFSSCHDQEDYDEPIGYFKTPGGDMLPVIVSAEAGEIQISMEGTNTEKIIPIVFIADEEEKYHKTPYQWDVYEEEGTALIPSTVYKEAGYAEYPNSLDFGYRFQWATFSTYKPSGDHTGVLKIKYDENPTDQCRWIWVFLKNEKSGTLALMQEPNS